jgi:DNA-directed RNA polymerase specialized sigma subunit
MDKAKQIKYDKRYHNTTLLLRNYKEFKKHCIECESSLDDVDNTLEAWELTLNDYGEDYIKSAKRTKARTQIIVNLIDRFLNVYKEDAIKRKDINKLNRYKVIDMVYISDNITFECIAEKLDCDRTTVSRYHRKAIDELSVLFFGIEGLRLEA